MLTMTTRMTTTRMTMMLIMLMSIRVHVYVNDDVVVVG